MTDDSKESIADEFKARTFRMKVVEKEEKIENCNQKYFVTLQMVDRFVETPRPIIEREMTFDQYCFLNINDYVGITLYSYHQKTSADKIRQWYFSHGEAIAEKEDGVGAHLLEYKYKSATD